MIYIYARVSTDKQTTASQLLELKAKYPGAEVIEEQVSGWKNKPALNALITRLRRDDVLVVAGLDRIGRHAWKAIKTVEELNARGVQIRSERENIDTSTPAGKFVLTCMFGVAELERGLHIERTLAGMARVRAEGIKHIGRRKGQVSKKGQFWGRPAMISGEVVDRAAMMRARGVKIREIARKLEISVGSVSRLLKKRKDMI